RGTATATLVAVVVLDHPRLVALIRLGGPHLTGGLVPLGPGGANVRALPGTAARPEAARALASRGRGHSARPIHGRTSGRDEPAVLTLGPIIRTRARRGGNDDESGKLHWNRAHNNLLDALHSRKAPS